MISNSIKMGLRKKPLVFTQEGIAMLSSVLNSEKAIQVNIQIMRAFMKLREIVSSHKKLWHKIIEMEDKYDGQFRGVFEVLKQLLVEHKGKVKRKIGFIE